MGAVAGLLLIAAAIVTVRYFSLPPLSPQPSAPSTQAAPAALPLPDKPSIVVLPFDNMSKDPEQDYFSNGITEVLTSDLSQHLQPVRHRPQHGLHLQRQSGEGARHGERTGGALRAGRQCTESWRAGTDRGPVD